MHKIIYQDFDLLIEPAEGIYKAKVVDSPAGQASSLFSFPLSSSELENFFLQVRRFRGNIKRKGIPETETIKELGGCLFNAVFQDEIRICLLRSTDEANRQGYGLRIRLRLADAPELFDLPWEYLYHAKLDHFLSLSMETPIVRYIDLPNLIPQLSINPPLRILIMISNPQTCQTLDVEHEWSKLKEALADLESRGMVELERLDTPMLTSLQKKLRH